MIKVYGSEQCPYCMVLKENLDRNHAEYEFVDILKDLHSLGAFLALRDREPVFDHLKAVNDIGVPAVVAEDGRVLTDWESYLTEKEMTVFIPESSLNSACSIDGKGC